MSRIQNWEPFGPSNTVVEGFRTVAIFVFLVRMSFTIVFQVQKGSNFGLLTFKDVRF